MSTEKSLAHGNSVHTTPEPSTDWSCEPTLMDITLYPHRSLNRTHARRILWGLAIICGLASLRFIAVGAWPVAVFVMFDVWAIWFALSLSTRAGQVRERLLLTPSRLIVERKAQRTERWSFEPTWLKIEPVRNRRGVEALRLSTHHGQVSIASFLNEAERSEIHAHLQDHLARWRAGDHRRSKPLQP